MAHDKFLNYYCNVTQSYENFFAIGYLLVVSSKNNSLIRWSRKFLVAHLAVNRAFSSAPSSSPSLELMSLNNTIRPLSRRAPNLIFSFNAVTKPVFHYLAPALWLRCLGSTCGWGCLDAVSSST